MQLVRQKPFDILEGCVSSLWRVYFRCTNWKEYILGVQIGRSIYFACCIALYSDHLHWEYVCLIIRVNSSVGKKRYPPALISTGSWLNRLCLFIIPVIFYITLSLNSIWCYQIVGPMWGLTKVYNLWCYVPDPNCQIGVCKINNFEKY